MRLHRTDILAAAIFALVAVWYVLYVTWEWRLFPFNSVAHYGGGFSLGIALRPRLGSRVAIAVTLSLILLWEFAEAASGVYADMEYAADTVADVILGVAGVVTATTRRLA